MKKLALYLSAIGTACLSLSACNNFHAPYTVNTGADIESEVVNKINDLDIKLFSYLKGGEFDAIYAMSTESLAKRLKDDTSGTLLMLCRGLRDRSYRVFDEFYITSILPNTPVSITTLREHNNCRINFIAPSAKTDLSILAIGDSAAEYLMSALCIQSGEDWKLTDVNVGVYSVYGMTAPTLYAKAQQFYKQNDLVDAANYMAICKECMNPIDTNWRYNDHEVMERFASKVLKEANKKYSFPVKATEIKTTPSIFSISMCRLRGRLCPQINYVSTIPIKDTAALRQENLQLRKFTRTTFAPMHDNNSIVNYRAFNEMPDGHKQVLMYGFVEEIR